MIFDKYYEDDKKAKRNDKNYTKKNPLKLGTSKSKLYREKNGPKKYDIKSVD